MAWYDPTDWDWGRIGTDVATGGLAEGYNAIKGQIQPDITKTQQYKDLEAAAHAFGGQYGNTTGQTGQAYNENQGAIQTLQGAANGTAPSQAEALQRKGADEAARAALGIAATTQGANPGAAARAGLGAAADAYARSNSDAAALRANEMATARGQLASATGANEQAANAYNLGTGQLYEQSLAVPFNAVANQQSANQAFYGSLLGDAAKIGGPLLAASDPELKTDAHDGGHMSDEFLNALAPKTYRYEDESNPLYAPGKRLGVMADKLPSHDVSVGPDGKRWISADVISDVLAGMGRLHERLGAMEGRR